MYTGYRISNRLAATFLMRGYGHNATYLALVAIMRWLAISLPYRLPFFYVKGLTLSQIFILGVLQFTLAMVWEVPSGIIADRWGRIRCLRTTPVVAVLLIGCALVHGFWPLFALNTAIALVNGLIGGADNALLFEALRDHPSGTAYQDIEQRIQAWQSLYVAIGLPVGALLVYLVGPSATIFADGLVVFVSAFFAFGVHEATEHSATRPQSEPVQDAIRALLREPKTRWLLCLFAVLSPLGYLNIWLPAAYYVDLGIPFAWFGVVFAVRSAIQFLVGHLFRMEGRWLSQYMLMSVLIAGLAYVALVSGLWWLALSLLLQDGVTVTFAAPLRQRLNLWSRDAHRSAINSVLRLAQMFASALYAIMAALLIGHDGLNAGLLVIGISMIACGFLSWWRLTANQGLVAVNPVV